eukprot:GHVT01031760.1.p1 GENE.GHVT01031760.1~~GHVT01031760.1.p1  ORF type:complete len:330 (+),score=33.14 GHVT01031760.1:419-1408(+)
MAGRRGRGSGMGSFQQKNQEIFYTESWVGKIVDAIVYQDGQLLPELLKFQSGQIPASETRTMTENVMNGIVLSKLRKVSLQNSLFKKLLLDILKVRQQLAQSSPKWIDIVDHSCNNILPTYMELYTEASPCAWLVPGLAVICNFIGKAATAADTVPEEMTIIQDDEDREEDMGEMQNRYTQKFLNIIRPLLGRLRLDYEREGGYIVLLGQTIKGCSQMGNMQLAAGFLRLTESMSTTSCSGRAPRGPLVNFRQYLGKLFMQQEKFAKAEEELVWAFSNCPTYAVGIRRNILECLLAVRLRMGKLPPTGLLRKYGSENMAKVVTVAYAAW